LNILLLAAMHNEFAYNDIQVGLAVKAMTGDAGRASCTVWLEARGGEGWAR
jgi:hypothetical protein